MNKTTITAVNAKTAINSADLLPRLKSWEKVKNIVVENVIKKMPLKVDDFICSN